MYAITFDMDTDTLAKPYHAVSYNNACADIGKTLAKYGFNRQQGSVYFGSEKVDAVMRNSGSGPTKEYSWFGASVRDIRMLRIEDLNDLRPAIGQALELSRGNRI